MGKHEKPTRPSKETEKASRDPVASTSTAVPPAPSTSSTQLSDAQAPSTTDSATSTTTAPKKKRKRGSGGKGLAKKLLLAVKLDAAKPPPPPPSTITATTAPPSLPSQEDALALHRNPFITSTELPSASTLTPEEAVAAKKSAAYKKLEKAHAKKMEWRKAKGYDCEPGWRERQKEHGRKVREEKEREKKAKEASGEEEGKVEED